MTVRPEPAPTVTIAVFDVTCGGVEVPEFVVVAGCVATAVIATCPTSVTPGVAVVGTVPGAV